MTAEQFEIVEDYFADLWAKVSGIEARLAYALPTPMEIEDQIDYSIDRALRVSTPDAA